MADPAIQTGGAEGRRCRCRGRCCGCCPAAAWSIAAGARSIPRLQFLSQPGARRPAGAGERDAAGGAAGRRRRCSRCWRAGSSRGVAIETPDDSTTEAGPLDARAYRPADQDPAAPVLVFAHMGGGVIGDLDTSHLFCGILAAVARGAGAVGRLPPGAGGSLPGRARRHAGGLPLGAGQRRPLRRAGRRGGDRRRFDGRPTSPR